MSSSGTLSQIAEITMGQSPNGEDVNENGDGFPLLNGPTEFTDYYPVPVQFTTEGRKFSDPGDILFCVRGSTTGKMNYSDQKYAIGRGLAAIRGKGNYPTQYIRALIEKSLPDLLQAATGSTFPNVGREQLLNLNIEILGEIEAQAVGSFLKSLDDKIELNRQTNQTLEQMAQAIFQSWFVDFDPVHAKKEGRDTGLPPHVADLFPDDFVESELGMIPKGWEVGSIYYATDIIYGAPFASSKFNSEKKGYPIIRIRDLKDESPEIYTPENHPKGYMVQPGDVLVGMDGEFRAYLWGGEQAWLNQRVCVLKPKSGFSAAFVRSSMIPLLASVEASETATTVIHLGKNDLDKFRIVIPDQKLLTEINKSLDAIYNKIVYLKREARLLVSLRDSLLPKLLSGELKV